MENSAWRLLVLIWMFNTINGMTHFDTLLILKYSIFISCLSKIELRRCAMYRNHISAHPIRYFTVYSTVSCIFISCLLTKEECATKMELMLIHVICAIFFIIVMMIFVLMVACEVLSWCGYGLITYWMTEQQEEEQVSSNSSNS